MSEFMLSERIVHESLFVAFKGVAHLKFTCMCLSGRGFSQRESNVSQISTFIFRFHTCHSYARRVARIPWEVLRQVLNKNQNWKFSLVGFLECWLTPHPIISSNSDKVQVRHINRVSIHFRELSMIDVAVILLSLKTIGFEESYTVDATFTIDSMYKRLPYAPCVKDFYCAFYCTPPLNANPCLLWTRHRCQINDENYCTISTRALDF